MKLWVDDIRPAPEGYKWCHSVSRVLKEIQLREYEIKEFGDIEDIEPIELIDLDHDAGISLKMVEIILNFLIG